MAKHLEVHKGYSVPDTWTIEAWDRGEHIDILDRLDSKKEAVDKAKDMYDRQVGAWGDYDEYWDLVNIYDSDGELQKTYIEGDMVDQT